MAHRSNVRTYFDVPSEKLQKDWLKTVLMQVHLLVLVRRPALEYLEASNGDMKQILAARRLESSRIEEDH
nr:BPK_HP1_G0043950.mRNA.1.CDS.1 [Saccharomyces cerevisiae]